MCPFSWELQDGEGEVQVHLQFWPGGGGALGKHLLLDSTSGQNLGSGVNTAYFQTKVSPYNGHDPRPPWKFQSYSVSGLVA